MARVMTFGDGTQEISVLDSYAFWKQRYPEMGYLTSVLDDSGSCPRCNGFGEGRMNGEPIRCLCQLVNLNKHWRNAIDKFGSHYDPVKWEDISEKPKGGATELERYLEILEIIHRWNKDFDKWMMLVGNPGRGKSYILQAIATEHAPYAIYVNSGDFEQRVFRAMQDKQEGETITDMIDALSCHPILLFDDIGSEYSSPFPKSILRNIIDQRYRFWKDYTTFVTTNLVPKEILTWDPRTGDRLMDVGKSEVMIFTHRSWRRE